MIEEKAGQVARAEVTSWALVFAGMLGLAAAMGIGRFAFTPLLPMMLNDGVISLRGASFLASANYFGYLLGAMFCTFQPLIWRRVAGLPAVGTSTWVRIGLVGTCVLTLGMALPVPALWPLLRFAAGLCSALVFVFGSSWVLAQLVHRGAGSLGGAMFAGPGAGITISGLLASAMVAMHWPAAMGWLFFGVLATVLTAFTWKTFHVSSEKRLDAPAAVMSAALEQPVAASPPAAHASQAEVITLALAYGLAGFGYIITATFLPVIARQALPPSFLLDMFWPLFGVGVVTGALISSRMSLKGDLRYLLAACYFVQAMAIGIGIVSPTLPGFAIGSFILGVPFTVLTFFAMHEVRRLRPLSAPSHVGLLTVVYGIGQVAGPALVAVLLRHASSVSAGFTLALQIAAGSLVLGAVIYLLMVKAYPLRPRV